MEDVASGNRVVVKIISSSCNVIDAFKTHIVPCINLVEGVGSSVLNMSGDDAE
jgi:hypothetical protein